MTPNPSIERMSNRLRRLDTAHVKRWAVFNEFSYNNQRL